MKRDYNRVEAVVMYNNRKGLHYVMVNCNMKPLYTKYYYGTIQKIIYDDHGRILMAYTDPSGINWVFKYVDDARKVWFSDQDGYEYWEKYDDLNRIIEFKDNRGNDHRYVYSITGYYKILRNTFVSEFSEVQHFDINGNLIHSVSNDLETFYKYNDNHELIWEKIIKDGEIIENSYNPPKKMRRNKIKTMDCYYLKKQKD